MFGTFLKQSNYFGNSQAAGMETRNINKTSVFKKPTTRINMLQMEPQTMFSGVLQPLSLETIVNLFTALKQQYFDILTIFLFRQIHLYSYRYLTWALMHDCPRNSIGVLVETQGLQLM